MHPEQQFPAFANYQAAVGADQAQLVRLLCEPCSNLTIGGFEDELTEVLLRYLRYVTCVPWYREWEINAKPDGQYGTIYLLYDDEYKSLPYTSWSIVKNAAGEELADACEQVVNFRKFTFRLRVIRDQGRKMDQERDAPEQPAHKSRSARDVLAWAQQRTKHNLMITALAQAGIFMNANFMGRITNVTADVNKNWERQATSEITIFSCASSFLRIPALSNCEDVEIEHHCEPGESCIICAMC